MGHNHYLTVSQSGGRLAINLDEIYWTELLSKHAWVLKLEYLADDDRDPLQELDATAEMMKDDDSDEGFLKI